MMMVSEEMRMALATVHIPLEKVSGTITNKLVYEKIKQLHQILKDDFHIEKGKIAVLALRRYIPRQERPHLRVTYT